MRLSEEELKKRIRSIPNFPKKGVVFRDITTLLKDKDAFREVINKMAEHYKNKKIDVIVAPEARGFIIGAALAYKLGVGFIPVRKPGKLPAKTMRINYQKEYGMDGVEVHEDGIKKGQRVLIVDDVVATGGTIKAVAELVKKLGGEVVGLCFLVELSYLNPRENLKGYDVFSLIKYEKEDESLI
jgi:adenine phosphoribosyltransferase